MENRYGGQGKGAREYGATRAGKPGTRADREETKIRHNSRMRLKKGSEKAEEGGRRYDWIYLVLAGIVLLAGVAWYIFLRSSSADPDAGKDIRVEVAQAEIVIPPLPGLRRIDKDYEYPFLRHYDYRRLLALDNSTDSERNLNTVFGIHHYIVISAGIENDGRMSKSRFNTFKEKCRGNGSYEFVAEMENGFVFINRNGGLMEHGTAVLMPKDRMLFLDAFATNKEGERKWVVDTLTEWCRSTLARNTK